MIKAFVGADTQAIRTALKKALDGSTPLRITADIFTFEQVRTLAQGTDLFGEDAPVVLDGIMRDSAEFAEAVCDLVPTLAAARRMFYLVEEKLLAAEKRTFERHGDVATYDAPKEKKEERSNAFACADAFARKERARAWVEYQRLLANGDEPEKIHGMLFWKVKQMIEKGSARPDAEVRQLLADMADLPVRTRVRGGELALALEVFLLER